MSKVIALLLTSLLLACTAEAKSSSLPDWAKEALKYQDDAYNAFDEDTDAVVLENFARHSYDGRGGVKVYGRHVVHLKSKDERALGLVTLPVTRKSDKIANFRAWIQYPSGKIETFNKNDLIEVATDMDALYSESKVLVLDRTYSMRNDTVFAYEYEVSSKTQFGENYWMFQLSVPCWKSRYEVELPKGWSLAGHVFNLSDYAQDSSGSLHVWEARQLPGVKEEAYQPAKFASIGFLGVSVLPDEKAIAKYKLQSFQQWNDLARFAESSQVKAMPAGSSLAQKAKELAAGSASQWETIRRICEYAQSVNYVAVNMNLAKGGGYYPREADFVFEKHFGDCKDMTVLARSMLDVLGIESFPIIASIGGEEFVHEEWASPAQFNHCVLGVRAPEGAEADAIVDDPHHGRLLIFDPTRKFTPFGRLPNSLWGTRILVGSSATDGLIDLPYPESHNNAVTREIEVAMDGKGSLSGAITEVSRGNEAVYMRRLWRSMSEEDFSEMLSSWISRSTRDAKVSSVKVEDSEEENRFTLELGFDAPYYARIIGDWNLVFSPVFLSRREWVPPTGKERSSDYLFYPLEVKESIRFEIPEGFEIEDFKDGFETNLETTNYAIKTSATETAVLVDRYYSAEYLRLSKERYGEAVEFFEGVTRMEASPVVLVKVH